MKQIFIILIMVFTRSGATEINTLKTDCSITNTKACMQLGDIYRTRNDFKQMKRYYETACMYNEPQGCIRLA